MSGRIGGNQTNSPREATDLYPTDPRWTKALLEYVNIRGPIWECAAGDGDMVDVLTEHDYEVRATDILTGEDFFDETDAWKGSIVTNPPYRHADEFIEHALALATEQVAMLLPIGSLGGQRRMGRIWGPNPPSLVLVVVNRMPVLGKPSQLNHIWAVWDDMPDSTEMKWVKV